MAKKQSLKFIEVSNKSYGKRLRGMKIYYEGTQPSGLKDDGSMKFGKNLLELLQDKFKKNFKLILTQKTDSVAKDGNITLIKISSKTLGKMYSEQMNRTRDIKLDIIRSQFSQTHALLVSKQDSQLYTAGKLNRILHKDIISKLSSDDKDALNKFIPDYFAQNPGPSINKVNASAQLKTLKQIAAQLKEEIKNDRSESWWQTYIKANILVIQQGYIKALTDLNVGVGTTKFPDFLLVTHDNYLDVLEIKKPSTKLLSHDNSRDNYYFDKEPSRAIIQAENYINLINENGLQLKKYIQTKHEIELNVVKPRGIILAGSSEELKNRKMKDDFRTLTQSLKNIVFITYDELLVRLENYINVLELHSTSKKKVSKKARKKT